MNYLIVVAHPDDEVLGAGGTIYKLIKSGNKVSVCILSGEVSARNFRPSVTELNNDLNKSLQILGVTDIYKGHFPNIQFNNVNHIELVKFIEEVIINTESEVIFTHHPNDLNNDHLHTSLACQAAIRLYQRIPNVKEIKELLFMEILSSTDWALNPSLECFKPNTFIEVGSEALDKKIEALSMYKGVMRDYPHPRSFESLKSLATLRGSQAGMNLAESFQSVYRCIYDKKDK